MTSGISEEFTRGPMPARLAVGVISAGRVGTALGEALAQAGHVVASCTAVSDASVSRAATRLAEARILPPTDVAAVSELLILAVPDTELPGLVRGLAACGTVRPGTIVLHTSGAHGISILAPLTEIGVTPLAVHPAMTFIATSEDTARLPSSCFGVTAADEVGYAIAQGLVLEMGAEPVRVSEEHRVLYHAALAHGANHLVTLVADAVAGLRSALRGNELPWQEPVGDTPRGLPERVIAPLLSAALDNALRHGRGALTGPVARDDAETVARHLAALEQVDAELATGYRALARRTAQTAGAGEAMFEVLNGGQPG
ncbi:putative short-subunit dehydrogenase-like oxidoreductase (DUF2520 family) [Hoyosella altamirensis]|uniref:Putative short-subunit dehydrogenase-like oxidoreductase (DUF2520 family) n=2 Tax=Hoyosella altamirensis TaxID=616997 RepID=A0A839RN93_9ACTN|nr:putative short-subunit dehydrogenase-like oxidoreductase (DUF2520 family) [Hoyosella altamirensis]